ncbi:MAG: GTP-binding protein [Sphaerochaeta sp.]|nr:GTP-binding protein [Sphaerochaeta sp.]
MEKSIPFYILTGFLGSGKTSVINSLLSQFKDKKIGLILNDFGSINIDSALVQASSDIVSTKSLSGGQIFCSCLSGSFIKSVIEMSKLAVDVILVEASGLAKPVPLLEIASIIIDQGKGTVTYGGMVCIVDAERYPILSQVLKTIEEQIVFSDWFIVNKSDLVSEESLKTTIASIEALKPHAPIFTTTFGLVDNEMMNQFEEQNIYSPVAIKDSTPYHGWGVQGRPKNCVFTAEQPFELLELERLFTAVAPQMLRIKGFLPAKEAGKVVFVDVVGNHVKLGLIDTPNSFDMGVMCLYNPSVDAVSLFHQTWASIGTSPSTCVEHA